MRKPIIDDDIEKAADKLMGGQPLTRTERRLLDSPQSDFAMAQVRAMNQPKRAK